MLGVLAVAACLLVSAQGAQPDAAQPDPPAQSTAPNRIVLDPTYHLPFNGPGQLQSIAFAPDGSVAYVHLHGPSIDPWPIFVGWWPEIGGGITALAAIALAWCIVRVRREPRRRGAPYCRRCGYDLSAHVTIEKRGGRTHPVAPSGTSCPECGRDIAQRHRINIGRGTRRRLYLPIALAAAAIIGYGAMLAVRLPRQGRASAWVDWSSVRLVAFAKEHQLSWLTRHLRTGDIVVKVDLSTGKELGTLAGRRSMMFRHMTISPDGGSLFLGGTGSNAIYRISTRSGRTISEARVSCEAADGVQGDVVIGFSPDGTTAYFQGADQAAGATIAFAWHLATGQVEELCRDASFRGGDGKSYWARHYKLWPGDPAPRLVCTPDFMEAFPSHRFTLHLQQPNSSQRAITLSTLIDPSAHLALTPDGKRAFVTDQFGQGILGVDLDTGEELGVLPVEDGAWATLAISVDGRLLAVPSYGDRILIRDLRAQQWLANLQHPSTLFAAQPTFSADGRWLGAVCQVDNANPALPGGHIFELLLYDLAPVRKTLRETPAAPLPARP